MREHMQAGETDSFGSERAPYMFASLESNLDEVGNLLWPLDMMNFPLFLQEELLQLQEKYVAMRKIVQVQGGMLQRLQSQLLEEQEAFEETQVSL